jgi:hypothetical protein
MIRTVNGLMVFAILAMCSYLNAEEPVSLFDGKTLKGWDVLKCEAEVKDKAILLVAGNGLVQTKKRYRDFILEYEWKALKPDKWDSGVYFRYQQAPEDRPWPNKYQVNLRKGLEGELVGFADGKNTVPIKPGEWNRFELKVKGREASLQVNGKAAWKVDGIEVPSGYISLQAEIPGGGQFLFRNIRITELRD